MRDVLSLCLLFALTGCAAPHAITASDMAGRAKNDVLGAQYDFARRRVVVHGAVQKKTLATRQSVVAQGYAYYAVAQNVREDLPLVIMEPGTVFCYFEPRYIDEVIDLKQGDQVAFRCRVDSFHNDGREIISILGDCRREKP